MPIEVTIHPERALAYLRFSGHIGVQDYARAYLAWVNHPDFSPNQVPLSNTLRLESVDATFVAMLAEIGRVAPTFHHFRDYVQAVIHAPSDVTYGVARMLQQLTEPVSRFRFDILRSEAEALQAAGQNEIDFDSFDRAVGLA